MKNLELLKIENVDIKNEVEGNLNIINTMENDILLLENRIKLFKVESQKIKEYLLEKMTEYNIKSLETEKFKITRVDETTKKKFDVKKLEIEEPQIYNKYLGTTNVKAYLRLTEKKEKENIEVIN